MQKELTLLRASHEKQVVESIQQIRENQVDEAMTDCRKFSEQNFRGAPKLITNNLSTGLNQSEDLNLSICTAAMPNEGTTLRDRSCANFLIPDVLRLSPFLPVSGSVSRSLGIVSRKYRRAQHLINFAPSNSCSESGAITGYDELRMGNQLDWQPRSWNKSTNRSRRLRSVSPSLNKNATTQPANRTGAGSL
jgi:hypothetical protein